MAINVLSIDEAYNQLSKAKMNKLAGDIIEKGRGKDKKPRKKRGKVPASKYEMKVLHFQHNKGLTPGLAKRAAMKWFMDRGYDTPPHWNEEFGKAD
jgi:hypothetical protein